MTSERLHAYNWHFNWGKHRLKGAFTDVMLEEIAVGHVHDAASYTGREGCDMRRNTCCNKQQYVFVSGGITVEIKKPHPRRLLQIPRFPLAPVPKKLTSLAKTMVPQRHNRS